MKIKSSTTTTSVRNFVETYTPEKTLILESIQRGSVWGKNDKEEYYKSINKGMTPNPIILSDLESSFQRAKEMNLIEDQRKIQSWINEGYEWISIDGGNRTEYKNEKYQEILDKYGFKNLTKELKNFLEHNIDVKVFLNLTISEMHELAINVNKGKPWNNAEKRNAKEGYISDFIRECVKQYKDVFSTYLNKTQIERKVPSDIVGNFLYYFLHRPDTLNIKTLNSLYQKNHFDNVDSFKKILSAWSKVVLEISKSNAKKERATMFNLFCALVDLRSEGYELNPEKISEFAKKYITTESSRIISDETFTTRNYVWRDLNRHQTYYKIKSKKIQDDLADCLITFFIVKDRVRNFTEDDKIKKIKETKGVVKNLDGSTNTEDALVLLNGKKYHADHIFPYAKGGQSNDKNLQFLTKEDNLKKSDS
jgi:hypothetical protein